jgi:general secretion pathway protein G
MYSEYLGRPRRHAFSLVEVMVVVVIIGLLAGAVAIRVHHYMDKAKSNRARADIATIASALETFYAEKARYPSNEEGLAILPITTLKDPWGHPYQYNQPGRDHPYEVISFGADAREGGEGQDADIVSWDLAENP